MPHPSRKLGRKPRGHANLPHYSQLRRAARRQDIPSAKSWLNGLPADLGMMLNGADPADPGAPSLGCCTCSALGHAHQVWSFNATGQMRTIPNAFILKNYELFCGYNPADPSTDQGGVMQDILVQLMNLGFQTPDGPDMPLGYVEVDPRLPSDIREVIALAGIAYLGMDVLDSWTEAEAGGTWRADRSPVAGKHCVIAAGYDADGLDIISWGMRFRMPWESFAGYCSEAYFIVDQHWIEKTGQTPGGLTLDELAAAMATVRETA
jgi:hypothetical protein